MKVAAISLLSLVTLAALYIFVRGPVPTRSELTKEIAPPARVEDPGSRELPGRVVEAKATPLRKAVEAPGQREPVSEPAAEEPAAATVQGKVILVEDSGIELTSLSGVISLLRWSDRFGKMVEVEVHEGAFEVEVAQVTKLSVQGLSLDGRGALVDEPKGNFPVDAGPMVVRAHWPRTFRLNVLSREDSSHLSDVTILREVHWQECQHPGPATKKRTVLGDGMSPLNFRPPVGDAGARRLVYFIHSPGFAWKPIHLNLAQGGSREIRLEPGGDVEIQVIGEVPGKRAFLRMRRVGSTGHQPYAEFPARREGPIEISGLLPGTYKATVEVGETYGQPLILGEVEVEVEAGQRTQQVLSLDPPREEIRAGLAGWVVVPAEWKIPNFRLGLEMRVTTSLTGDGTHRLSKSDMQRVPGRDDTWSFDFGEIPTGLYELELLTEKGLAQGPGYSMLLALEAGGLADVRLELPPPARVVVHLVDGTSGEVADIRYIFWGALSASSSPTQSHVPENRPEGKLSFEFQAPLGEIKIGAFGNGYDSLDEKLLIHPGLNEYTFQLEQDCPLTIVFLDREAPVPPPDNWWPEPEHLDGEGQLLYTRGGAAGFVGAMSEPGRYLFDMPEFPDFEAIPQQTITVQRGEDSEHLVELVRKQ